MRRFILMILVLLAVALPQKGVAQYNRNYIYWVGQQCMVDNKYREAIDILNVLIRQDERNFDAFFLRGIAKYNMDDLLGADADFTTAVTLNPVFTGAFYYRAITRTRLGNYDDALNDFQQAIELRLYCASPLWGNATANSINIARIALLITSINAKLSN